MALKTPIPVRFGDVFPHGAFAVSVKPVSDFEAFKGGAKVQAWDRATGLPLWTVAVIDPDPEARDNSMRVKIAAPVLPVLPDAAPGMVMPYLNNAGRLAYSFRAGEITPVGAARTPNGKNAAA